MSLPFFFFFSFKITETLLSSTQGQNSGSSNSSDTSSNNNTNKRPAPVDDDDNFPSAPFHLLPLPVKRPLPLSSFRSSSPVPEFPTSEPSFMVGPPSISDLYHSAPSSPGPPLSPSDAAIGDAFLQSSTFANATTKDRLNCPICSTALIKISLPEHIHTVHLGRKPYVCRVDSCNFTTGYHSSIKCHLRDVHKVHGEIELYYEYVLPGMSAAGEK
ncbi:hypothetical protein TYRP_009293 [Tyrophagus putrescentiae]|nr:hypothetical protein TYRP_009293 [Tyrophagus putrescentiae]